MKFIVIDIQGFFNSKLSKDGFEAKELTIYDGQRCEHFTITSPRSLCSLTNEERKEVRYLEKFYHGINYSAVGNMDNIEQVKSAIVNILDKYYVDCIYVRGHQKLEFLNRLLYEAQIKIVNVKCQMPKFYKSRPSCFSHNLKYCMCSKNNCIQLYNDIVNNMLLV